ncbi:MAG: hypothetical protein AB8B48_20955 [Pseudomonadales bacterium]
MFIDSRTLLIRFMALWAVVLFCIVVPTPLALAVMVVLGHAYFVSALGDTLRTSTVNGHFCLRLLTLCVLIIGSNALWGWALWLNERIPHEFMALAFLSYCSYRCLVRKQRASPQTIGSHTTLTELFTLMILFAVCLAAYILLDHPVSNLAHYLFEPAYFYLWFAIHCVSTSGLQNRFNNQHKDQETTYGSLPM